MQESDKTQEVLDRVEALARELGAVGAETAGQLMESYARAAAVDAGFYFLAVVLLATASAAAWRLERKSDGYWEGFMYLISAVLTVIALALLTEPMRHAVKCAVAPEWHLVKELLH